MSPPPKEVEIKECFQTISDQIYLPQAKVSHKNSYLAAFAALLFVVVTGMLGSFSAPATVDMKKPGSRFRYSVDGYVAWIASLPFFSGMFGNGVAGYITQAWGRKTVMMLLSLVYVISFLTVAYAPTMGWIIAGRAIGGICGGICAATISPYVVEIAPPEIRGRLSSGFGMAYNLGGLLLMIMGIFWRWSWLAVASAVGSVLAAAIMLFIPESPPWLVSKSKTGEAVAALKFLRGKHADITKEIADIQETLRTQQQQNKGLSWKDIIEPTFYKPLGIGLMLGVFLQFTGVFAVLAYVVEIFENAGSTIQPNLASAIVSFVSLLGNLLSGVLLDKFGRRLMFFISGAGTTLFYLIIGSYSYIIMKNDTDPHLYGWLPLVCLMGVIFSFGLGVGVVPFIVIPELTPICYRSAVVSITSLANSLFAFCVIQLFEPLRLVIGIYGLYWIFAMVAILSAVYCFFFLPETKGMSLSEIQKTYQKSSES